MQDDYIRKTVDKFEVKKIKINELMWKIQDHNDITELEKTIAIQLLSSIEINITAVELSLGIELALSEKEMNDIFELFQKCNEAISISEELLSDI